MEIILRGTTFTEITSKMGKRNNPDTSHEAWASLNPDQLAGLRKKIYLALVSIKQGHYEDIAAACNIEPVQCWKRLSELHKDGLIHRTGERKMLSSNRMGFVWAPGKGMEDTLQKKKELSKTPTISDHSRAIKKLSESINQQTLF